MSEIKIDLGSFLPPLIDLAGEFLRRAAQSGALSREQRAKLQETAEDIFAAAADAPPPPPPSGMPETPA